MKTAIVLMTLLGCDCEASRCLLVGTLDTGWQSVAACRADIAAEVASRADAYPTLVATCEARPEMGQALDLAGATTRPDAAGASGHLGAPGRNLGLTYARRGIGEAVEAGLSVSSTAVAWLGERIGIAAP